MNIRSLQNQEHEVYKIINLKTTFLGKLHES